MKMEKLFFCIITLILTMSKLGLAEDQLKYGALKKHYQVFPEVNIQGIIYKDIAVVYFTLKSSMQSSKLKWSEVIQAHADHPLDVSKEPMSDRLGFLLLKKDSVYYVVSLEDRYKVVVSPAGFVSSSPMIFQPLQNAQEKVLVFESEKLHSKMLNLPDVKVDPQDSLIQTILNMEIKE